VFIFCVSFLKERDCSLRLNRESNPVPNETHRAWFLRWRAAEREAMQWHERFRGAKLPRSNQKRGKQADEHGKIRIA
jgi:hypothetical protein